MDLQLKKPAYISSSFSDSAHLRVEATAVSQKLPLSEAAEAQAAAEKGGIGKILLVA
jgi:hypothetical protein